MPRQKRTSKDLTTAEKRAAGIQSIGAELDLGNDITIKGYIQAMESLRQSLTLYNERISLTDQAGNAVKVAEKVIRDYSERILLAVAVKYGKDSDEYEMAGGVRKSERKRPMRKPQ
jgi:phosphoribosylformimino-5-aminoimidazole carboxamide ribonucleotide (ProFAR) isomerase